MGPNRLANGARRPLVVVGDSLLDVDLVGTARRLCPDAPVPVVEGAEHRYRPGGAALAAALAADDGHDVVLVSAFGDDPQGHRLRELLRGLEPLVLPLRGDTPVKTRMCADGQVLLRVDEGGGRADPRRLPATVTEVIRRAGAILVADYGRGVAAIPALREALARRPARVPLVWDPHPRGPEPLPHADLLTPNHTEAEQLLPPGARPRDAGAGSPGRRFLERAGDHARRLRDHWRGAAVAVTLGAGGAVLVEGEGEADHIPTPETACGEDTCGAGDRFAVSVAAALGRGTAAHGAVTAGVAAATRFVARGGAAALASAYPPVRRAPARGTHDDALELVAAARARGERIVATGGCFDILHAGHVSLLHRARTLGDVLIVCVNDDGSVRRLKGPGRPITPAQDRVQLLSALECVDAVVVFAEDTPTEQLRRIRPDVWVKGGDYEGRELPESGVVRQYGGEVVTLPHLAARSTTKLVESIRATAH